MSARSVKISKVGADYINKYLNTKISNGQLQVVNSTNDALYFFQGSEILDSVNVILPVLAGDDTFAFQNNNNEFGGVQTFNKGIVTQGGLLLLPDPLSQLEDDLTITDGLNIVLGINQGTAIGTDPSQLLGFFGNNPISQPGVTVPSTSTTMVQDMWNALVNLGLISAQSASATFTASSGGSGVLPSNIGGRYGIYQADNTTPAGIGLLNSLTLLTGHGTSAATFINNRPAITFPTGATSGNAGGFRTTNPILTLSTNPTITFKVTMSTNTTDRLILGLSSSSSLVTTGFNHVLDGLSGVMVGFGSGDTGYSVVYNNGATSETGIGGVVSNNSGVTLQTAGTPIIVQLSYSTSTLTWSIKTSASTAAATGTVTTTLPAITTPLYLYCGCQTNASSAVTLTVEDVEVLLGSTSDFNVF